MLTDLSKVYDTLYGVDRELRGLSGLLKAKNEDFAAEWLDVQINLLHRLREDVFEQSLACQV